MCVRSLVILPVIILYRTSVPVKEILTDDEKNRHEKKIYAGATTTVVPVVVVVRSIKSYSTYTCTHNKVSKKRTKRTKPANAPNGAPSVYCTTGSLARLGDKVRLAFGALFWCVLTARDDDVCTAARVIAGWYLFLLFPLRTEDPPRQVPVSTATPSTRRGREGTEIADVAV